MAKGEPSYRDLLAVKAEKLEALRSRKPGQKGYKRRLREFLDADAAAQAAVLARVDDLLEVFEEDAAAGGEPASPSPKSRPRPKSGPSSASSSSQASAS